MTSIVVVIVAGCVGVLVSAALFRIGPEALCSVFFLPTGAWRRYGRAAWLGAMVALLLIGLLVTPQHAP